MTAPADRPDTGMDGVVAAWAAVEKIAAAQSDLRIAVILFDAVNRSRALIASHQERGRALEAIVDLGSDGEHSGDRHARCRDIARAALSTPPTDTTARDADQ